ncbi:MAG TPA: SRPBCC family protein [Nocardioidaceae bacterium]|nr:SRPBCC family protein [Nocardioidaceae bacterium]
MTTTTHKRSVHIDAPVEKVFDYVKDPRHFWDAFPQSARGHDTMTDVSLTPDAGVGSTYRWKGSMFIFHIEGVSTREEYIPNERFVDRSSTGPVWTFTFEPDPTGTTLSLAFEYSTKVPLMDKVVDRVAWNGDEDLDKMLANLKRATET